MSDTDEQSQDGQTKQENGYPQSHKPGCAAEGTIRATGEGPKEIEDKAERECRRCREYRGEYVWDASGNGEPEDAKIETVLGKTDDGKASELTDVRAISMIWHAAAYTARLIGHAAVSAWRVLKALARESGLRAAGNDLFGRALEPAPAGVVGHLQATCVQIERYDPRVTAVIGEAALSDGAVSPCGLP